MIKKTIITVVCLLFVATGGWFIQRNYTIGDKISDSESFSPVATSSSSNTIKAPVSFQDLVNGEVPLLSNYKNNITGDLVSFVEDKTIQARNKEYKVYLNGEIVGTMSAQGVKEVNFSPAGKYFSLRSRTVCGASCFDFRIYVVDLANKKISLIKSPKESEGEISFIESYEWKNGAIELVFYPVTSGVRTSAKEVWRYDLKTQKYTLLKTIVG